MKAVNDIVIRGHEICHHAGCDSRVGIEISGVQLGIWFVNRTGPNANDLTQDFEGFLNHLGWRWIETDTGNELAVCPLHTPPDGE